MADSPDGLLSVAVLCEGRRGPLRQGAWGRPPSRPHVHAPAPQAPAEECRQTSPGLCLCTCPYTTGSFLGLPFLHGGPEGVALRQDLSP